MNDSAQTQAGLGVLGTSAVRFQQHRALLTDASAAAAEYKFSRRPKGVPFRNGAWIALDGILAEGTAVAPSATHGSVGGMCNHVFD